MRVLSIAATNFKGRNSFEYQLQPKVVITGPNFAGKTAIHDAIRLAFRGFIPEIGKRPSATWELASGGVMSVQMTLSEREKFPIVRTWRDGRANPVSISDEAQAIFDRLPLLDAEAYFGMTEGERVNYICSVVDLPSQFTADAIVAALERYSAEEEHTEEIEAAKREFISMVAKFLPGEKNIQGGIGNAIEALKGQYTYWNKRSSETQGAVTTLTELKLRENEASSEVVAEITKEIEVLRGLLDGLNQKTGEARSRRSEAARVRSRMGELKLRLKRPVVDHSAAIAELDTALAKETETAKNAPTLDEFTEAHDKLHDLTSRKASVEHELNELENKAIPEHDYKVEALKKQTACPHCLSKSKGWKANLSRQYDAERAALEKRIRELGDELKPLPKQIEAQDAEVKRVAAEQAKGHTAREQVAQIRAKKQTIEWQQSSDKEQRAAAEKELATLTVPDVMSDEDFGKLEADRINTANDLSALNGKRDQALKLQQDIKRAAQSQLEHQRAKANVTVIKAFGKTLNEKRAEMIAELFNSVLNTANAICEGILVTPLAFHEGEVGRWSADKFIPHRVFSGTEKALTYIAIAAALSMKAPVRVLLLDEIGRLDPANQLRAMNNLGKAVDDGVLDQVIVAGVSAPKAFIDAEDWQHIQVA
jgi:hypothetical protein